MAGWLRAYLAEALGTFGLVFVGAGSILADAYTGGGLGVVGIAAAFGLVVMAMVYAFGRVSGGHFNPAVTGAMLVTRRIGPAKGVFYVASQLLGASAAAFLLAQVYKGSAFLAGPPFLGACDLADVSFRSGVVIEAAATFLLVLVVFATAVDPKGPGPVTPLAIGLTVAADVLWAGPLTGAALNPARAFGPAIASGHWANHLVYWIGPLVGGAGAGLLYEFLYLEKNPS